MKSADLIGQIKFLPWGQLDGCVTRPFFCVKGVAVRLGDCYTSRTQNAVRRDQ